MNRISSRRFGVVLRRLSPLDFVALAIVVLYVVLRVARAFGRAIPFTSFLGFLTFVALLYFAVRLLPWIRTKLLWRLRSRLVVAYVFIAVVPVVLLLAMVGVAAYLLYLQFGAHLLNDDLEDRISTIVVDTTPYPDAVQLEAAQGGAADDPMLSRPGVALDFRGPGSRGSAVARLSMVASTWRTRRRITFAGLVELEGKLWIACGRIADRGNGRPSYSVGDSGHSRQCSTASPRTLAQFISFCSSPRRQRPTQGVAFEIKV